MATRFSRGEIDKILHDENLEEEQKREAIFGLYGRALDDGYISKNAAQAALEDAVERAKAEAVKGVQAPDVKESDEYKALLADYENYKAMQTARVSEDFADVKPKFFEPVYAMIDRKDGAKPVKDQIADIRAKYEEYFTEKQQDPKPSFGASTRGSMPTGETGAKAEFLKAWGQPAQKG